LREPPLYRPLGEVADAHRDSARQDAQGKTVLVVDAALSGNRPGSQPSAEAARRA
jgi:hypothetical protein